MSISFIWLSVLGLAIANLSVDHDASALDASSDVKGGWQIVTPEQVQTHLQQRRETLAAAMGRDAEQLIQEDFDRYPVGRLGQGVHGETVLDSHVVLGYTGKGQWGDDLCANIAETEGGRVLHLVDRQPQSGIYARFIVKEACGRVSFDVISPKGESFTCTLGAYQAALVVPSERDWRQWLGSRSYAPTFVYLAGTASGYMPQEEMRENYRPISARVRLRADVRYRVVIEWDHQRKRCDVWIDGKNVVRDKRFLSNTGSNTDVVVFRPGSFTHDGLWEDGEIMIDNVEISALVWPVGETERPAVNDGAH